MWMYPITTHSSTISSHYRNSWVNRRCVWTFSQNFFDFIQNPSLCSICFGRRAVLDKKLSLDRLMSNQSMMLPQVSPPCSINRSCFILYVSSPLFSVIYFQTLLITIDDFSFFVLKFVSSSSTILWFFRLFCWHFHPCLHCGDNFYQFICLLWVFFSSNLNREHSHGQMLTYCLHVQVGNG